MAQNQTKCDTCQVVKSAEETHGWLQLRTLVSKPSFQVWEELPEVLKEQLLKAGIRPAETHAIGGEFCQLECLMRYLEANKTMLEFETQGSDSGGSDLPERVVPPPAVSEAPPLSDISRVDVAKEFRDIADIPPPPLDEGEWKDIDQEWNGYREN